MKKKTLIISIIVIALIVIGLFIASGGSRTDVFLKDFELSQDGKTMTLKVGVSSSAGYIRKMKRTSGSMNYYFTFYSTFGINSRLGAKDTFTIDIDNNVDEIYFYTGGKGYKKVLELNDDGEWVKVSNPITMQELKLEYRASLDIELEPEQPEEKNINLKYANIPEMAEQKYNNNKELAVFTKYIKDTFDVELDSNWNVFVHYYDEAMTVGLIQFNYMIDEIQTNKTLIFNLNNGIADVVYYKFLDKKVDEEKLLNSLKLFKDKYTQEKKEFKDDEKLDKERIKYNYYFGVDKLVYSYALFYAYGEHQLINNDYGTTCIIDENGNAIQ